MIDARLTIEPPRSGSTNRAASHEHRYGAVRLTSSTSLHCASDVSSAGERSTFAALFTRMSRRPHLCRTDANRRDISSGLDNSHVRACAIPPRLIDPFRRLLDGRGVSIDDEDMGAGLRKGQRDLVADPTCASGDKGDPSGEVEIALVVLCDRFRHGPRQLPVDATLLGRNPISLVQPCHRERMRSDPAERRANDIHCIAARRLTLQPERTPL